MKLDTVSKKIQEMHNNGLIQTSHVAKLQIELEEIKETLSNYEVTQEIDVSSDIPKYALSFSFSSSILRTRDITTILHCPSESSPSILDTNIIAVAPIASLPTTKEPEQNKENATLKMSCSLSSVLSSGSHSSVCRSHKIGMSSREAKQTSVLPHTCYFSYFVLLCISLYFFVLLVLL